MAKKNTIWLSVAGGVIGVLVVLIVITRMNPSIMSSGCPGSQVYCPGVGCVSGEDKCFPSSKGGASKIFSKETFDNWPGAGVRALPPIYEAIKETFVSKKCPDGTRSDGPCLMEF